MCDFFFCNHVFNSIRNKNRNHSKRLSFVFVKMFPSSSAADQCNEQQYMCAVIQTMQQYMYVVNTNEATMSYLCQKVRIYFIDIRWDSYDYGFINAQSHQSVFTVQETTAMCSICGCRVALVYDCRSSRLHTLVQPSRNTNVILDPQKLN